MGSESGQIIKVFTDMNQKTLFEQSVYRQIEVSWNNFSLGSF